MTLASLFSLCRQAINAWIDDYAPSMGAALAYYTLFSIAPLLLIVVSIAGLVFGPDAARGEIFGGLRDLIGDEGAIAAESLLQSVNKPAQGIAGTVVGVAALLLGAASVFGELQDALDRIWRAPPRQGSGLWNLVRTRLVSFGMRHDRAPGSRRAATNWRRARRARRARSADRTSRDGRCAVL